MNRRQVLRLSTLASLAYSLPGARAADKVAEVSPEMAALSRYMAGAARAALPAEVVEAAKHHLLDSIAAIVSGSKLPPGEAALRYARKRGAAGKATVIASDIKADPVEAAMVNAMMAHSDETDDSHERSRSHPGCSIVPASLAMGEQHGISGGHFLRAVTLGYDVGTRVMITLGGPKYSYESHRSSHAIAGGFGSAAGAACAAGLEAQQMAWVLDYAAQQSAGIAAWQRDKDHIEKAFVFAGMPARNGVTAALVVEAGWTGIGDIFTGSDNYFQAFMPAASVAGLVDKLGERYEIANTDIKRWSVGSPIQAPLDAMEAIRKRQPFTADQVRDVSVHLAPPVASIVDNRDIPDISLQYMVAVTLLDGTATFAAAHDKGRMRDADVLRQREKVRLVHDESLTKLLPARVCVVEITLADGTKLVERVEAVRGTVRNRMTRGEVADKCRDLIDPVLGAQTGRRLIEAILAIEQVVDVRELRPLMVV
jgi:2-methylcitrate dehydratase PrpD